MFFNKRTSPISLFLVFVVSGTSEGAATNLDFKHLQLSGSLLGTSLWLILSTFMKDSLKDPSN